MKANKFNTITLGLMLIALNASAGNGYQIQLKVDGVVANAFSENDIVFSANKTSFNPDDTISLTWDTSSINSDSVSISGIGEVNKSGAVSFVPGLVSEITISVTKGETIKTRTIPVTVTPYSIGTITLSSNKTQIFNGDAIVLTWSVLGNPKTVSIEGIGNVSPSGSKLITPSSNSITLISSDGKTTQTKTLALTMLDNSSCNKIHTTTPLSTSGVYVLNINGNSFNAYCQMDSTGGWTLIGAQYESNPIGWTGDTSGYDPTLASMRSFMLPSNKIPLHSSFAVGKDLTTTVKLSGFTYTTGNIPKTRLSGYDGAEYWIYRDLSNYYGGQNPDGSATSNSTTWNNTLTVELTKTVGGINSTGNDYTWAFAPQNTTLNYRGYSMQGVIRSGWADSYAWTIWVK